MLVERNVRLQIARFRQLPLVQTLTDTRGLALHGCVYDLSNGRLLPLETDTKTSMNKEPCKKGGCA
jgi:carbonic anhydrase